MYADGVLSSANAPGCPTAGMNMGPRPSLEPIQSIAVQKASRGLVATDSRGMNPATPDQPAAHIESQKPHRQAEARASWRPRAAGQFPA
jgi:hypothetical protein